MAFFHFLPFSRMGLRKVELLFFIFLFAAIHPYSYFFLHVSELASLV